MHVIILGMLLGSVYGTLEIRCCNLIPIRAELNRTWGLFMFMKGLTAFFSTYLTRAIASAMGLEAPGVVAGWSLITWSVLMTLYGCIT
jgi:hypothetical protein